MANFGSNFLRTFNPNFANMFDVGFKTDQIKRERERVRQEELKAQQEQAGILDQLVNGKLQNGSYRGKFAPLDMSLNQQDQTNLVGRASDDTLQRYKIISEMRKPQESKQQKTVKVGSNLYLENPLIQGMPMGSPIYTEEKAKVVEDFIPADTVPGLENYKRHTINRTITKNPDGTETIKYGQPFSWISPSININTGESSSKLGDKTLNLLEGYNKDIQSLASNLEIVKKGGKVMRYDIWGQEVGEWDQKGLEDALSTAKGQLKSTIVRNGGQGVSDYERYKPQVSNPAALWDTVYENYKRDMTDEKDAAWFMEARFNFIADYGFDPIQKFHQGLIGKDAK